jgi:hypothetical protein
VRLGWGTEAAFAGGDRQTSAKSDQLKAAFQRLGDTVDL